MSVLGIRYHQSFRQIGIISGYYAHIFNNNNTFFFFFLLIFQTI